MQISDKILSCVECGNPFTFTVSEQEFFSSKGFTNEPKRCVICRTSRNSQARAKDVVRQHYPAVCAECGLETTVPFQPKNIRPVYCQDCYREMKNSN